MSVQRTVERVDAFASEHVSPASYFDRVGLAARSSLAVT
jgi:hypothetical protein